MVRGPRNRSWFGGAYAEEGSARGRELFRNGDFVASRVDENYSRCGMEPTDDASRSAKIASLRGRFEAGVYLVPAELVADRLMEVMMGR